MSEKKISLLNCDFTKKKIRISSPLSLTALHLIGATIEDLRFKSIDEYLRQNIQKRNIEKELQIERYTHYEENRKNLIKEAKTMRANLLKEKEEETNANTNNNTNIINNQLYNLTEMRKNLSEGNLEFQSTAIKLEKEKLHKFLEKEENSIKFQIDYECKMEENRRKKIEKLLKKELKDEKRRKEKEKELIEKKEKEREKFLEKKRKEEEMIKEEQKIRRRKGKKSRRRKRKKK